MTAALAFLRDMQQPEQEQSYVGANWAFARPAQPEIWKDETGQENK